MLKRSVILILVALLAICGFQCSQTTAPGIDSDSQIGDPQLDDGFMTPDTAKTWTKNQRIA